MKTAFSAKRMEFTKRAHRAAQGQFYAHMFPGLPIAFEDTVDTVRDLEYAIDCQVAVSVGGLRAPLRFSVQERWREPKEMHWGDVTITEWNNASGQPSELHKLGAQLFVYGFYDPDADRVLLGVAVNVLTVLHALALGKLAYRRSRRLDQTFLGFDFGTLKRLGAVVFDIDHRPRSERRCVTCDAPEAAWDATHRLYQEGAAQCPGCAEADELCDPWANIEVAMPGSGLPPEWRAA